MVVFFYSRCIICWRGRRALIDQCRSGPLLFITACKLEMANSGSAHASYGRLVDYVTHDIDSCRRYGRNYSRTRRLLLYACLSVFVKFQQIVVMSFAYVTALPSIHFSASDLCRININKTTLKIISNKTVHTFHCYSNDIQQYSTAVRTTDSNICYK